MLVPTEYRQNEGKTGFPQLNQPVTKTVGENKNSPGSDFCC